MNGSALALTLLNLLYLVATNVLGWLPYTEEYATTSWTCSTTRPAKDTSFGFMVVDLAMPLAIFKQLFNPEDPRKGEGCGEH